MGLDPENPDYEPGLQCADCRNVLFDGSTPKYVEADVFGIENCPDRPGVAPDGTYGLTQIDFCIWQYQVIDLIINWQISAVASILVIQDTPWKIWFKATVADGCIDAFANQNVCGVGPAWGGGGYVTLWWGPTIGK